MDVQLVVHQIWAKTRRQEHTDVVLVHPLIHHLMDTAAVTLEIWDRVVGEDARRMVAEVLGIPAPEARRWLAFLVCLHDIGKCTPGFQYKYLPQVQVLRDLGLVFPLNPAKGFPHDVASERLLRNLLVETAGLSTEAAWGLASAVSAHHGTFILEADADNLTNADLGEKDLDWRRLRAEVLHVLSAVLMLDPNYPPPVQEVSRPALMVVAGITSVADWIASNEDFFPYDHQGAEHEAYWILARHRSSIALDDLEWRAWSPKMVRCFADLFPFAPRPLQVTGEAAARQLNEPFLLVAEAPMGEGKTELALYLAHHGAQALGHRGAYFALPTQATSNQMLGRVREFLETSTADSRALLQLLHGHAALSADFSTLLRTKHRPVQPTGLADPDSGNPRAQVIAAEWFTYRKRGLLSPFGVGTVDQAMLAALQADHVFVRLWGLAHKTVIIDEVHAYDAYMLTVLIRMLEWLSAVGTSVVMLSATLPTARRDALVHAYARGRLGRKAAPPIIPAATYPRITWTTGTRTHAEVVKTSNESRKRILLRWLRGTRPDSDVERFTLGERLQRKLRHGGCAVIITNSVDRAQKLYQALKPYFPAHADDGYPELELLHARAPFNEREVKEKRVIERFGKHSVTRPKCAVLVATQVVEQSLDVDFDLIVTDLAPVDLVLQRIGRGYRHPRRRPPGFHETVLEVWLLDPGRTKERLPHLGSELTWVYDRHILLRSWLALKPEHRSTKNRPPNTRRILIPNHVSELVEFVYSDEVGCPAHLPQAVQRYWSETRAKLNEVMASAERMAKERAVPEPDHRGDPERLTRAARQAEEEDLHEKNRAMTRLGDSGIRVACVYRVGDGISLDSEGTAFLELTRKPQLDTVRSILERSVVITSKAVEPYLRQIEVPSTWRESAWLRGLRPLVLDRQGHWERNDPSVHVRLCDELGVVIHVAKRKP